ncbi:MAG: hypothetical protein QME88_10285 [Actinomycetota bacterium]|nr:hypothetical protein [Actinomycetota bacterium]
MKAIRILMALVIGGSLAATGVSLVKVIGVQRVMGEKQGTLLEEVRRQDSSIEAMLPAFQPTEEMVAKTGAMLEDLRDLASVVTDMNGLVRGANDLQAETASLLDRNNQAVVGLSVKIVAAANPLAKVGERTGLTLQYINQTLAALWTMARGLSLSNTYAADLANMMEGKFEK